jgi:tartrate dehydrogenase/decarboxylase/D-malate dehydrogenase
MKAGAAGRRPTTARGGGKDSAWLPLEYAVSAGGNMPTHRIAVIPGDGIGKEVVPEGLRALEAAGRRHGIDFAFTHFDWNCDYYAKHGRMMPEDWFEQLSGFEAIYYGAVGWPATVPDHVSLWGSLIQFRRRFDQYVNLRPCRLMPGIPSPLAGRKPGDIDFVVVRENTEGEYSSVGGRMYEGTEREVVFQESVFSRKGVDRIVKFAFELARTRPRKKVTSATKSNGISITMPFWDERFRALAAQYPDIATDAYHIDILTAHFVQRPQIFDVVVGSNLFGDILSDLGPAVCGTIGIAPSANLNPERDFPSLFEPVHGSAPDIAGKGIANPIGQIWSGAMMLEFLGHPAAAAAVVAAIERTLADPAAPRTPDLGGRATTVELGRTIAAAI